MRLSEILPRIDCHKLFFTVCLSVFTLVLQHLELLKPWDNQVYDIGLMMFSRPANEEIVIIAVDEYSLKKLGKWPWPRRTHAELIELLTAAEVKAVGLDIIFAEQDHHDPAGDQSLIDAVRNNGRVILPVFPEKSENIDVLRTSLPWPELADAAAGLGHVDVQIDNDGVVRSAYLIAGIREAHWPALPLALFAFGKPNDPNSLPGERNPDSRSSSAAWRRDYRKGSRYFCERLFWASKPKQSAKT